MISAYTDLYPLLKVELPGVPEVLLLQYLRQVGREFCRETEAWRVTLDAMNIVSAKTRYALATEFDAAIYRILDVKTGGEDSSSLDVSKYSLEEDTVLVLEDEPTADLADGLVVKIVLLPYLFATKIDDWFMEKWAEGLVAGTKAILMKMTNKAWSDPRKAAECTREYDYFKALAIRENYTEGKVVTIRTEMREW